MTDRDLIREMAEALDELLGPYTGGAASALDDEYVVERSQQALTAARERLAREDAQPAAFSAERVANLVARLRDSSGGHINGLYDRAAADMLEELAALADSEGTRAVNYLRRARAAEAALAAQPAAEARPQKERPDFIAGYDAGLKDGRACAERDAAEARPVAPAGWIACDERMPDEGAEVLVWVVSAPGNGYAAPDQWIEYHEDPTGMGGPTLPMGLMWRDNDPDEVTHWMPLPPPPGASATAPMAPVVLTEEQTFEPISDDEQASLYRHCEGTDHYSVVRRLYRNSCKLPPDLFERERAATICDDLAEMMERGAGECEPGERLRQAARNIREGRPSLSDVCISAPSAEG